MAFLLRVSRIRLFWSWTRNSVAPARRKCRLNCSWRGQQPISQWKRPFCTHQVLEQECLPSCLCSWALSTGRPCSGRLSWTAFGLPSRSHRLPVLGSMPSTCCCGPCSFARTVVFWPCSLWNCVLGTVDAELALLGCMRQDPPDQNRCQYRLSEPISSMEYLELLLLEWQPNPCAAGHHIYRVSGRDRFSCPTWFPCNYGQGLDCVDSLDQTPIQNQAPSDKILQPKSITIKLKSVWNLPSS